MAKIKDIIITLDHSLTATRIKWCYAGKCKHNRERFVGYQQADDCGLKDTSIEEGGRCSNYEKL